MPTEPLVKVVVTTYNRLEWARMAIESVFAQTYPNLHVVIVDDASSDGTADLGYEFAALHPGRVTVVAKRSNRGLGDSIRLGIEAGPPSDYVAFLNDDDLWRPEKLACQVELLQSDPSFGLVYCEAEIFDQAGNLTGDLFSTLTGGYETCSFEEILVNCNACSSTLVVTHQVAQEAARGGSHPPCGGLCWDFWLLLIASAGAAVGKDERRLAFYRVTTGAMHFVQESEINRDMMIAREAVFQFHPELVERLGGERAVRRRLGLRDLNILVWEVRNRQWGHYLWHARWVLRQRQLRLAVWMVIHTVRGLMDPV